jgi:hypothetical protein
VQEVPSEAVEVPQGQLVDALGWSKDGRVGDAGASRRCTICRHHRGPPGKDQEQHAACVTPPGHCFAKGKRLEGQQPPLSRRLPSSLDPLVARPCDPTAKSYQVLTVSTSGGQLISYLAALPTVFGAHGGRLAHLTSLSEITVVDLALGRGAPPSRLQVACEPAFCAVGPEHIAVGMNNQVGVGRALDGWEEQSGQQGAD